MAKKLVKEYLLTKYYLNRPFVFFSDGCWADEHEARLMRFLMAGYDAAVRPVENSSQPLTVIFGVSLHHIIDVVRKPKKPIKKYLSRFSLSMDRMKRTKF